MVRTFSSSRIDGLCNVSWMRLLLLSPGLVLASFENASARAFYVSDFIFPDLSEPFSVFVQGLPNCLSCSLVLSRYFFMVGSLAW